MNPTFRAFRIHNDDDGYRAGIEEMPASELSPGEVLVKVAYSSVNFKDALAGTGKLIGHCHDGFWRPADTFKERAELDCEYNNGNRPWALWESGRAASSMASA